MLIKRLNNYVFNVLILLLLLSINSFALADVIDFNTTITKYEIDIKQEWYVIYFGLFAIFFLIDILLIVLLRKKTKKDVNNQND